MNNYYYGVLLFFSVLFYLVIVDKSIASLVVLLQKYIESQLSRTKWFLLHNPNNPIVRYFIWRNSLKNAKEIQKYLKEKNK